ncbi:MAG: LysR family transcriptional regulator, partial [Oscillospiraceae bacterium]
MELLQIKYFRIIAETENISKAAQQLFIAQPSLSQTLILSSYQPIDKSSDIIIQ